METHARQHAHRQHARRDARNARGPQVQTRLSYKGAAEAARGENEGDSGAEAHKLGEDCALDDVLGVQARGELVQVYRFHDVLLAIDDHFVRFISKFRCDLGH